MIESFFKYLLAEKQYSKLTISSYRGDISQFCSFMGSTIESIDLNEVSHKDIRSFIMELNQQGKSVSSINRKLSSLKSLFRYLCSRGYISSNPSLKLSTLKGSKRLPNFVDKNSASHLLEQTMQKSDNYSIERDRSIITLFYTTGLRLSELVELNWEDYRVAERELLVRGKGNKQRLVPLCSIICSKLDNLHSLKESLNNQNISTENNLYRKVESLNSNLEPLFLSDKGVRISRSYVYRMINTTLRELGVDGKCSPHVLRHTFATHLIGVGVGIESVKELLGHSSLATTQIYTQNSIEQLIDVRDKFFPKK